MSKLILFQGDSITDCGRARDNAASLGTGYPLLVKSSLGYDCPNEYQFINKGVSGNRVVDLYARIKSDLINLKPDYLSIYIGVNDAWHELDNANGVDTAKFEKIYSMLIDEVKSALPNIRFMILSPYLLKKGKAKGDDLTYYERFAKDVAEKHAVTKRLAEKYNVPFVDLQEAFNEALNLAEHSYWTIDGVHPTPMGHELIKRKWLEAFEKIK